MPLEIKEQASTLRPKNPLALSPLWDLRRFSRDDSRLVAFRRELASMPPARAERDIVTQALAIKSWNKTQLELITYNRPFQVDPSWIEYAIKEAQRKLRLQGFDIYCFKTPVTSRRKTPEHFFYLDYHEAEIPAAINPTANSTGMQKPERRRQLIESLFQRHGGFLINTFARKVGRDTAEDIVAQTFMKALQFSGSLDFEGELDSNKADIIARKWLFRIATNTGIDYIRRTQAIAIESLDQKAEVHDFPSVDRRSNPAEHAELQQIQQDVQLTLSQIKNPRYRLALILFEYMDMSYEEIAQTIGTTAGTVKTTLHRGRTRFKKLYPSTT